MTGDCDYAEPKCKTRRHAMRDKFYAGDSTFRANQIMKTFDADQNGKISWKEAKAAFSAACTGKDGEVDKKCMKSGNEMFKAVNTKTMDGGLKWYEVKNALEATGVKARE